MYCIRYVDVRRTFYVLFACRHVKIPIPILRLRPFSATLSTPPQQAKVIHHVKIKENQIRGKRRGNSIQETKAVDLQTPKQKKKGSHDGKCKK